MRHADTIESFLLVVQWIERVPPKRQIQVRFLSRRPHRKLHSAKNVRLFFFPCDAMRLRDTAQGNKKAPLPMKEGAFAMA